MSGSDQAALAEYGYPKLKRIDPYHPTIGAVNGGFIQPWAVQSFRDALLYFVFL
jgi:hypothetical protein